MTRKDYILIANALKAALETEVTVHGETSPSAGGVRLAANRIAFALGTDNKRFSHEHFMAVVRGEKDLNSRPARLKSRPNAGLTALANHAGWKNDICDLCMSSNVSVNCTTLCGKTVGVECGCEKDNDGTCGNPNCEECATESEASK
jgi:hypothetical protein